VAAVLCFFTWFVLYFFWTNWYFLCLLFPLIKLAFRKEKKTYLTRKINMSIYKIIKIIKNWN
jgi:hypothetical protein